MNVDIIESKRWHFFIPFWSCFGETGHTPAWPVMILTFCLPFLMQATSWRARLTRRHLHMHCIQAYFHSTQKGARPIKEQLMDTYHTGYLKKRELGHIWTSPPHHSISRSFLLFNRPEEEIDVLLGLGVYPAEVNLDSGSALALFPAPPLAESSGSNQLNWYNYGVSRQWTLEHMPQLF